MLAPSSLIAIDIGSSSIKVAELVGKGQNRRLKALGMDLVPPDIMQGGIVKDADSLKETVANLLDRLKIYPIGRFAAVAFGGSAVLVRRVTIRVPPDAVVDEVIEGEPEKYLDGPIDQVTYDYLPLGEPKEDGSQSIMLVAARKDTVNRFMEIFADIGLRVSTIDVDAFALANMFEFNYGVTDALVALVNIGARATQVSLISSGQFLYTRELGIGGDDFTIRIAEALNIDRFAADDLKISICQGFQSADARVMKILGDTSQELANEVKRAIGFYFQEADVAPNIGTVRHLFLSGGGSRTLGLDAHFATSMNVPIQILDPFQRIRLPKDFPEDYRFTQGHLFGVAVGLALRYRNDKMDSVAV